MEGKSTSVYLHVVRKKTNLFLDLDESCPLSEVKRVIQGILKVDPESQKLIYVPPPEPEKGEEEEKAAADVEARVGEAAAIMSRNSISSGSFLSVGGTY
jgi:hypothetical protein